MSADEPIPSLASLRQGTSKRRRPAVSGNPRPLAPSLFDSVPPLNVNPSVPDLEKTQTKALLQTERHTSPEAKPTTEPPPKPRVWTVAALVREVRGVVERGYSQVTVEGEISNWRPAGSGHCYFTLKDGDAQLAAVMFRRAASLLRFKPKDGDAVRLRGQVTVYENRGQMQIMAESMELAGQGALLAAVQQLKERLRREGLFDRKRPLPSFPKCIGVITSLQGAALRDVVKVCRRRHAAVNFLIYPVAVQGPRCSLEVVAGLRWFSRHKERADVVIVARGGGSWEDLHGFDDEGVARAIVACAVPVISGIGHATDITIADSAADVCAPTPSAAAELVTAAQHHVEEKLERLRLRVLRAGRYELLRAKQLLWGLGAEAKLRQVHDMLRRRAQRLDELAFRVDAIISRSTQTKRAALSQLDVRLHKQDVSRRMSVDKQRFAAIQMCLQMAGSALATSRWKLVDQSTSRLEALSPLRVLDRGYALVFGEDGKLLRSASEVNAGQTITTRLAEGSLKAVVQSKEISTGAAGK